MKVGIVVPTIGRSAVLGELVGDVSDQSAVSVIAVVDQSSDDRVSLLLHELTLSVDLRHIDDRGNRGLSRSRNLGFTNLRDDVDAVVFLDDDCRISADALKAGLRALKGRVGAVTGRVQSSYDRVPFGDKATILDRWSVWRNSMESAMIVDAAVMAEVNGFDESLGIGAATPYQSGEGTDLLLRIMARGYEVRYTPEFVVLEAGERPSGVDYRRKARSYAVGTGRVYALNYTVLESLRVLPGPLLRSVAALSRFDLDGASLHGSIFVGRIQGLLSRRVGDRGRPLRRCTHES